MLELLIKAGEATQKHIGVKCLVPHVANRAGALMETRKIFLKGSKILGVGFSLTRCDPSRAVCFQRCPSDDRDVKAFIAHANSSPYLATFNPSMIEGNTVGCGHLNQFLACIADETEIPDEFINHPDLPSDGKKLDKHAICKKDGKDLAGVLDTGLKWTFVSYKIEKEFPKLPAAIQRALNTEHHIGEGETWDEQLRGLASTIKEYIAMNTGKSIDYNKVARSVLASQPPRSTDVPFHIAFCKKWGGGASQSIIFDCCTYIKLKQSSHIVGGSTFDALAKLKMPADSMCPFFIAAVVKCCAVRGASRNGVSIHISDAEIKSIVQKLPQVTEANMYMSKAAAIEKAYDKPGIAELRGDMECQMVDFVLGKLPKEVADKLSLKAISNDFIKSVADGQGVESPSRVDESAGEVESGASAIFDPTSNVVQQTLANHGWKIGAIVAPKKSAEPTAPKADCQYEIGYVNDDGSIGLYTVDASGNTDPGSVVMTTQVKLQNEFRYVDASMRLSQLDSYPQTVAAAEGVYMAAATLGVTSAYFEKRKCPADALYIQDKPSTKVIVKSESTIAAGGIVFPAFSQSLKVVKDRGPSAPYAFNAIVKSKAGDTATVLGTFTLDRPDVKEYPALEFWKLRRVSEEKHANMTIGSVNMQVPLPKIDSSVLKLVYVEVPTAVTCAPVRLGDELVLYVPAKEKQASNTKVLPVAFEPKPKRAKTS